MASDEGSSLRTARYGSDNFFLNPFSLIMLMLLYCVPFHLHCNHIQENYKLQMVEVAST